MIVKFNTNPFFRGRNGLSYASGIEIVKQRHERALVLTPVLRNGKTSEAYMVQIHIEDIPSVVRTMHTLAGSHAPNECPVCGELEGVELSGHPDIHPSETVCSYECTCGAEWQEIFIFNRVNILNNGK